ncbi:hypothetical protein ASD05_07220 [Variovorax sp. Root434]|nr:hypothetical protein ASD05_07220 [Variovorax sp. Root434]
MVIAWTLYAGKDVPWDALHYHLYAGFSALNERLSIDFYPAGSLTYLNPYAHLPLYLMVHAQWPSIAIGVTFACLHSVMLWMTYELARAVSRRGDGTSPAIVVWTAVGLALLNPVLLQEIGSSFTDVTTGTLALGGYVALANAFIGGRLRLVALAGVLLGAAAALKLSNAFLALVPALPLVLGCVATARLRVRTVLIFTVCASGAALFIFAPWAWRLEQAFGNPFFPMLNDVFHPLDTMKGAMRSQTAPHTSAVEALGRLFNAMRDPRFLPPSLVEALARPFEMLRPRRLIHTETMAPDARYAGLLLLCVSALAAVAWRRWHGVKAAMASSDQAFTFLAAAFPIGWVIWLAISGNSRYFLPMACVSAVLLAAGLHRVFADAPRVLAYALAAVFGVQGLLLWQATEFRWGAQPWGGQWVQATIPLHLQTEPYLYLPMDPQSQSFLLPSLAPGSAFLGISTGLTPEGSDGRQTLTLINTNLARLRMLKLVKAIESDGRPVAPAASTFDYPLRRFGLRVDTSDCDYINYRGNPDVVERLGPRSGPRDQVYLYTCRVVSGPSLTEAERERKVVTDLVLDRVEDACPELFPSRRASLRSGAIWRRNYADVVIWVNDDGLVRFADLLRGGGDFVAIGREEDWIRSPQKLTCWRSEGRAHVEFGKG